MSWDSRVNINNQIWKQFSFFSGGGANGNINEYIAGGDTTNSDVQHFIITEVRLFVSTQFVSVEDFVIKLSSITGSNYNQTFVSQAMLNVSQYLWQPTSLVFISGDALWFTLSMKSAILTWGLNVQGWAIQG